MYSNALLSACVKALCRCLNAGSVCMCECVYVCDNIINVMFYFLKEIISVVADTLEFS